MSEKQFEQCTLEEATHVEMGGKVHELGKEYLSRHKSLKSKLWDHIEVEKGTEGWQLIHVLAFPILGIKPLREKKQEPREFVHIFRKGSSMSYPSWAENGMFRCVEISEEIE
jgi:hypothetical protein